MSMGLQLSRILMEGIKHRYQGQNLNRVNKKNLRKGKKKEQSLAKMMSCLIAKQNKPEAEAIAQESCSELKDWPMSVKTRYFICAQ